jgi:hypothetical protein
MRAGRHWPRSCNRSSSRDAPDIPARARRAARPRRSPAYADRTRRPRRRGTPPIPCGGAGWDHCYAWMEYETVHGSAAHGDADRAGPLRRSGPACIPVAGRWCLCLDKTNALRYMEVMNHVAARPWLEPGMRCILVQLGREARCLPGRRAAIRGCFEGPGNLDIVSTAMTTAGLPGLSSSVAISNPNRHRDVL